MKLKVTVILILLIFFGFCKHQVAQASEQEQSAKDKISEKSPPYTDYCAMLSQEIQGKKHGFLAGTHVYYCGGMTDAFWNITENETLGFTHPMYRDGRARGYGMIQNQYGLGMDMWGWEFWRKVRIAYGTVVKGGDRVENPVPAKMIWRPDRQICEYQVNGVYLHETKFISREDVLCSIIEANSPVEIEFSGQSFFNPDIIGTFDGDPPIPFMTQSLAVAEYKPESNLIHIVEDGKTIVKPNWGQKAEQADIMYKGMSVLLTASQNMSSSIRLKQQPQGYWKYSFTLTCSPGKPLILAYTMSDDYKDALTRINRVMSSPQKAVEENTEWFNELLNQQIPYFRCSDDDVVKTYYYLWSLYFMYFTQSDDWEQYPHTQTAINNFMGLHCWDSWVYSRLASWVVDKSNWGYGNILTWKYVVPFKDKRNQVPDNLGKKWWSPVWMSLDMVAENAWQVYEQSADNDFLKTCYDDLFRPLFYEGGPTCEYGIDLMALNALIRMSVQLDRPQDVKLWKEMLPGMVSRFEKNWEMKHPDYYGDGPFRDIWNLAALMSPAMKQDWADRFVSTWIMNTETGFMGPVPLEIRPPDETENGIFAVSTISTWLAAEGMFRQNCDAEAVHCTLGHLRGMVKDFGFPVAPECWDPGYKPWGSMYYNWDGAMLLLLLERLAGNRYSMINDSFTISDHLPESWDYVHTFTPIRQNGKVDWCEVKITRKQQNAGAIKQIQINGCPLKTLNIVPWLEDRELQKINPQVSQSAASGRGHASVTLQGTETANVTFLLGEKKRSIPLLVRITPYERLFTDQITMTLQPLMDNCKVYYTTDDTIPTEKSSVYSAPLTFSQTTNLKVRAFRNGDLPGPTVTAKLTKAEYLESVQINDPKQGLKCEYYEGIWNKLPRFDSLESVSMEITQGFELTPAKRPENFAFRYQGYIKVPHDAIYYFNLKSNDGSQLYIHDKLISDLNIGIMGLDPWDRTGMIPLRAGLHPIQVLYHQYSERRFLQINWGENNSQLAPIPSSVFFYQ